MSQFRLPVRGCSAELYDWEVELSAGPTIIVVHPREKRRKCTVHPLRGRPGLVFWRFPRRGEESLEGYVRLGLGGPLLLPEEGVRGMLLLDGTWRLAERMEREFADLPLRSLDPAWTTAYPRTSKVHEDPAAGLATVEALYAGSIQLGLPTEGLLDHYHWSGEFQEINRALIERYSLSAKKGHLD